MDGSDPWLLRKISDLEVTQTEREIVALEESVASNAGDTMVLAEKNAALAAAKKRRAEMLIEDARKRVERNPTDLQFRVERGEHLMNAGHFREALPELQRAPQDRNARWKVLNELGRCYPEDGTCAVVATQLA